MAMPIPDRQKGLSKTLKTRPISFGGIFSKSPIIVAGSGNPRRSMSTRMSTASDEDNTDQQDSIASVSPQPNQKAILGSKFGSEDHSSSSAVALPLEPNLVNLAKENVDNRFSKFSFVPSYATSSVGGSQSVLEGLDEHQSGHKDDQTASRFGSVSTSSEYPPGTSQKVKSPPPGNRAPKNSLAHPSDAESLSHVMEQSFNLESSSFSFLDHGSAGSSEDGIMIVGESERGSEASVPLAMPVLRNDILVNNTNLVKSPLRLEKDRDDDKIERPDIVIQSPNTPTFAHVKEEPKSPRASRALHVPFLQRFKPGGKKAKNRDSSGTVETVKNVPHGQQHLDSFFDAASSEGDEDRAHDADDEEDADDGQKPFFLGNATQASFRKPTLVQHRSGSMKQQDSPQKMDITEALVRGPSGNSQNKDLDVGLSDASTTDNTVTVGTRAYEPRTEDEEQQKREDRRSGIIGWPTSERVADGPNSASEVLEHRYLEGDDRVSGLWNGSADPFAPNSAPAIHHVSTSPIAGGSALARNAVMGTPDPKAPADGLRSHPSVMAKVMRPAQQERSRSKVGFSLRADTEAARQAGKKWEKEDVISTPYPIPYEGDKEGGWERNQRKEKGKWASLTVLVYKRGGGMPKVTRLKIPSVGHEIFSSVMSGKPQEGGTVAMNQTFDDAKLALLLRGAYTSFRGPVLAKCGARTVCSVRLLGYTSWCQLATRRAKQQCFETKEQKDEESGFAEARLLELYRKPKIGNGKWEWWNWARGLPENQAVGVQGEARLERVALEIVEGWSARRIILAFSLVAICSVVACLLWIFAGVNRTATGEPLKGSPNAAGQSLPSEPNSSTIGQSSSHDGIAITGSHSTPSQVPTTVPGADTALFGIPSDALGPGSAAASLSAIINANGPTPTVIQRDTSSASLSTESSTVTSTNIPASAGQQPEAYLSGGPGSRVTAGVVLGLLVLLVGWMFLGAWLALSWTTG